MEINENLKFEVEFTCRFCKEKYGKLPERMGDRELWLTCSCGQDGKLFWIENDAIHGIMKYFKKLTNKGDKNAE